MASRKSIIKLIAAIKTIYSYYGKEVEVELLVDTWEALLANYSDSEVDRGIFMALRVCKYAPTPADVIEQIETFRKKDKPSESELWALYRKALKEVLYYSYRLEYNYIDDTGLSQGEQARRRIAQIWTELPEELKIYIGDKQELITSAKALNYSEVSYERNRFSKTFPLLEKRVEDKKIFLELQKHLLEEKKEL